MMRVTGLFIILLSSLIVRAQITMDNWKSYHLGSANAFRGDFGISYMSKRGDLYVATFNEENGERVENISFYSHSSRTVTEFNGSFSSYNGTNGSLNVTQMIQDKSNKLVIVGDFGFVELDDGTILNSRGIIRFDISTRSYEVFCPGVNGFAESIAIDEQTGDYYVSGNFHEVINPDASIVAADFVARWDVNEKKWYPVLNGVDGGWPSRLFYHNNRLYAAGLFTGYIDSTGNLNTLNHVAYFENNDWHAMGRGFTGALYITKKILADSTGNIIFGGNLDQAENSNGTIAQGPVLKWNNNGWTSLSNNFNHQYLQSLALTPWGGLYASWYDYSAKQNSIYEWNGSAWTEKWNSQNGYFFRLTSHPQSTEDILYCSGDFLSIKDTVNNAVINVNNNALYDGANWSSLQTSGSAVVYAMAENYVGGNIGNTNNKGINNIAAFNGTDFDPVGGGVNGTVYSMVVSNNFVVVGGKFTRAVNPDGTSINVNNLAMWDNLQSKWLPVGQGVAGTVKSLAIPDPGFIRSGNTVTGTLLVGGKFYTGYNPDGSSISLNGIGEYELFFDQWNAVGKGVATNNGQQPEVRTILMDDGYYDRDFYIGGSFDGAYDSSFNLIAGRNIMRWDSGSNSWQPVGAGVDKPVNALALHHYQDYIYNPAFVTDGLWVGGEFDNALNAFNSIVPSPHIAVYDLNNSTWKAVAGGTDGDVHALVPFSGSFYEGMYVFGDFSLGYYANRNARGLDNVAFFSLSPSSNYMLKNWNNLYQGTNGPVYAAEQIEPCVGWGENIWIGGAFTDIAGLSAGSMARLKNVNQGITFIMAGYSGGNGQATGTTSRAQYPCAPGSYAHFGKTADEDVLFENARFGDRLVLDNLHVGDIIPLTISQSDKPENILYHTDSLLILPGNRVMISLTGVDKPDLYAANPQGLAIGMNLLQTELPKPDSLDNIITIVIQNTITDSPPLQLLLDGEVIRDSLGFLDNEIVQVETDRAYLLETRMPDGSTLTVDTLFYANDDQTLKSFLLTGFIDPAKNQDGPAVTVDTSSVKDVVSGFPAKKKVVLPGQPVLLPNYPNPFNPQTTIRYLLTERAKVKVDVFDNVGRLVKTLIHKWQNRGEHRLRFNGTRLSSGIYYTRLTVNGQVVQTNKMLLIK